MRGIDKTYHMVDESFIRKSDKNKSIINTSRGPVIETSVLKYAIKNKFINCCVLDVWENEPNIDHELLNLVDIATPHIAGYSIEGKANGTAICIKGIDSFFNLGMKKKWYPSDMPSPGNPGEITIDCKKKSNQEIFYEAIFASYDIIKDDERLRKSPDTFENQRSNYPVRREFPFYEVKLINGNVEIAKKLGDIGFKIRS
jgi:erythronate-4-phosphate dehydrogenase